MIAVKWSEPDPGGAPVYRERNGVVVGWVFNHAVVMTDDRFDQIPLRSLRFVKWLIKTPMEV